MLLGRDAERQRIDQVLAGARGARSATLVLVGEAGIGKSALLAYAAEQAGGMHVLHARGIESEAQIPFASLLELVRPALGRLGRIPQPHAAALEAALALRPAGSYERFAVGAATLGLLAAYAEDSPVAVLIDDAHWLDRPSAEAVLFALRRMLSDRVAAVIAVRDGEKSVFGGADLPTIDIGGLTAEETRSLVPRLSAVTAHRLQELTGGNPLAIEELAGVGDDLMIVPADAPVQVPQRVAEAYVSRLKALDPAARRLLCLAAAAGSDDLRRLARAAESLGIEITELTLAERAGLISLRPGRVEFRHPLARSAIYAASDPEERRQAHHALAATLPDRDRDRRAWHLAAAAIGLDDSASSALEQAGTRSRERSAFATASAAYERAGRLASDPDRAGSMLLQAGEAAWHAGLGERAISLLDEARAASVEPMRRVAIDELIGHIATRRGPIMRGHEILVAAAREASADQAVAMLADAAAACFYAGEPVAMLDAARRAQQALPGTASPRARFLTALSTGMAEILGGDAGAGAAAITEAVEVADAFPEIQDDLRLLPWLAVAPLFLRESRTGRGLLEPALQTARSRAALDTLPFVLNLRARDYATTDRWNEAEMGYLEAIELSRETDQRTQLSFGLAGLAWLYARRGRTEDCRRIATEALELSRAVGARLHEVWAMAALGELELGLGNPAAASVWFTDQRVLLDQLGISDPDMSPAAELVDAWTRLGQRSLAGELADGFGAAASAKGQPWSLARAARCRGLLADDGDFDGCFVEALVLHAQTAETFEAARTQLAYGERLRRARNRRGAREQLRAALGTFETLGAEPWAERARTELAASGETLRRRDPDSLDELTPQERRIAQLLADGKTTREAAAALFVSPKTVEYHLRHVYLKLGVRSRSALTAALEPHSSSAMMPAARAAPPLVTGV